jgi:hypothetical protein
VYARAVAGRLLTLGVKGDLWQDNMVLYDAETWTLWSQKTGEAKRGPLLGWRLQSLPSVLTDWKTWRDRHPDGTVVLFERTAQTTDGRR